MTRKETSLSSTVLKTGATEIRTDDKQGGGNIKPHSGNDILKTAENNMMRTADRMIAQKPSRFPLFI